MASEMGKQYDHDLTLVRSDERIVLVDDLTVLCEAGDHYAAYLRDGGLTTEADALSATVERVRTVIGGTG